MLLSYRLGSVSVVVLCAVLLGNAGGAAGLRCYVCGGNSGTACQGEDEVEDGLVIQDPVQECNDLINNRGCVKQYVNGVVLLRGCWLDGTNKCLKNGAAEVCTCSSDLCNPAARPRPGHILLLSLACLAATALHNLL